jgi:hypothetical protein
MKCAGCSKDVPFYNMEPVSIKDKDGNVEKPRHTQLFCYDCLGYEKPKNYDNKRKILHG